MSLEAKGSITYNPDAKKQLVIRAPTLYIEEEIKSSVSKSDLLPELIDQLLDKMREKIQGDFNRPVNVMLSSYSVNIVASVHPINNRTLDEFQREAVRSEG
jgi:hypothetical protein